MTQSNKQTYAVFGLGRFGFTLAYELSQMGQDVIAVDKDMNLVEAADEFCTALSFDMTDIDAMKSAGIKDADVAIIATGSSLEDSILCTLNLKELGVPKVIVKARNSKHALALHKIGADRVVMPEMEMAKRLAIKQVMGDDLIEMFDLGDNNLVFEIVVKESWIHKSLNQINPRSNYNINVIALKRDNEFIIKIDPFEPFKKGDVIVAIASDTDFKKFQSVK